jgi:hypothetical protein
MTPQMNQSLEKHSIGLSTDYVSQTMRGNPDCTRGLCLNLTAPLIVKQARRISQNPMIDRNSRSPLNGGLTANGFRLNH